MGRKLNMRWKISLPGKVNPVIPEFVIQIGFRVIGNHQMCAMALDPGELESMTLVESALLSLSTKCLAGLTAPVARNTMHAHALIATLTELAKTHGYSTISQFCQQAHGDAATLRKLLQLTAFDANQKMQYSHQDTT